MVYFVIPADVGFQNALLAAEWMPAFAGMTIFCARQVEHVERKSLYVKRRGVTISPRSLFAIRSIFIYLGMPKK